LSLLTPSNVASALFPDTRQRVLGYLFGQPQRDFYVNQLIGLTGSGTGAVLKELARLEQAGLLISKRIGRQKHYQANSQSPVFQELCGLVRKTTGLALPLAQALENHKEKIDAAFVFGSVAQGTEDEQSDIDLMILSGTLRYADIASSLSIAKQETQREIQPVIFKPHEWAKKLAAKEAFVNKVMAQPKVWIIGDTQALQAH
jgi:predicted nucleotidyltransferase